MQSVTIFDINDYLSKNSVRKQETVSKSDKRKEQSFKDVIKAVNQFFHEKLQDPTLTEREKEERQQIEHKATLGDEEARNMLIDEINSFLRKNNLQHVKYPDMFPSLGRAIFEHIFGFKQFYKWSLYPSSPSAKIVGKEMWFKIDGKFVKQEEEFDSIEDVYEIIRLFQQGNRNFRINEQNPQGEIDLADGTRVTLTIPPRTLLPTIVFRRFVVNKFSFEEQAKRQTIAKEDIRLFQILAQLRMNIVIAGHVESGKSTMLKTFYSERPKDLVALLIEEHPETFLKRDFPDRLVHEFSIRDQDIHRVLRTILRFDHDYVIMQEVRGVEAEAAIDGASRGATGLLMTYHVTEPSKVVEQLAQHIIDVYPNRRYVNEVRRVAQTLHLGITMKNMPGNVKKVTSVYEICYDYDEDKAWINYLIYFNPMSQQWEYNADISKQLYRHLMEENKELTNELIQILKKRAEEYPLSIPAIQPIVFHEGRA
jgi:pilus assembly protein CpaF